MVLVNNNILDTRMTSDIVLVSLFVNFEHIPHIVLKIPLLGLNK